LGGLTLVPHYIYYIYLYYIFYVTYHTFKFAYTYTSDCLRLMNINLISLSLFRERERDFALFTKIMISLSLLCNVNIISLSLFRERERDSAWCNQKYNLSLSIVWYESNLSLSFHRERETLCNTNSYVTKLFSLYLRLYFRVREKDYVWCNQNIISLFLLCNIDLISLSLSRERERERDYVIEIVM